MKEQKFFENINPMQGLLFYIVKKYKLNNIDQALNYAGDTTLQLEFFTLRSFLTKIKRVSSEQADQLIGSPQISLKHTIFDNLMHYVAVNQVEKKVGENLISEWTKAGRKLTELDSKNQTPLNLALVCNRYEFVTDLVKAGVDITALDVNGFSPLHRLIAQIDKGTTPAAALDIWIKSGLPVNIKDINGYTPLYYAKVWNLSEVSTSLAQAAGNEKTTGLSSVSTTSEEKAKEKEKEKNSSDLDTDETIMISDVSLLPVFKVDDIAKIDVGKLMQLVDKGIGSTMLDANGCSILHYATTFKNLELLKLFINHPKVDVNMKNSLHSPAIAQALIDGSVEIAKALVEAGADLKMTDEDSGYTILHLLAEAGLVESVETAIKVGMNVNAKGLNGKTALDLALGKLVNTNNTNSNVTDMEKIITALVDAGTEINENTVNIAINSCNEKIINHLLNSSIKQQEDADYVLTTNNNKEVVNDNSTELSGQDGDSGDFSDF